MLSNSSVLARNASRSVRYRALEIAPVWKLMSRIGQEVPVVSGVQIYFYLWDQNRLITEPQLKHYIKWNGKTFEDFQQPLLLDWFIVYCCVVKVIQSIKGAKFWGVPSITYGVPSVLTRAPSGQDYDRTGGTPWTVPRQERRTPSSQDHDKTGRYPIGGQTKKLKRLHSCRTTCMGFNEMDKDFSKSFRVHITPISEHVSDHLVMWP